jgi:hypothetical protein
MHTVRHLWVVSFCCLDSMQFIGYCFGCFHDVKGWESAPDSYIMSDHPHVTMCESLTIWRLTDVCKLNQRFKNPRYPVTEVMIL